MPDLQKIAEMLSIRSVQIAGDRRPLVVDRLVEAGMSTLKPGRDTSGVLAQIAGHVLDIAQAQAQPLPSPQPVFSASEQRYIRVSHRYGASVQTLAEQFTVDTAQVQHVLDNKAPTRKPVQAVRRLQHL